MYHNVEKAHKKGASVSTMNEATHKETNTNPENHLHKLFLKNLEKYIETNIKKIQENIKKQEMISFLLYNC